MLSAVFLSRAPAPPYAKILIGYRRPTKILLKTVIWFVS